MHTIVVLLLGLSIDTVYGPAIDRYLHPYQNLNAMQVESRVSQAFKKRKVSFLSDFNQVDVFQKKSRVDSIGEGSGVEILENTPYTDGPGGSGQYTKKIYHIGSHLPGWLKAILPKAALRVEEEAWNAYPYTKMRTTCPFVEKFFVDVETFYLPDAGQQVF